jgi:uncharacterized OB-fold protein
MKAKVTPATGVIGTSGIAATSDIAATPPDWTRGGAGIVYQACARCSQVWYFRRSFCPGCGAAGPRDLRSEGRGTIHAGTLVHRAPTDEFRALAPDRIVLVDVDEGFRMMGHGEPGLAIGERVQCGFKPLGDRLLPYFEKETE